MRRWKLEWACSLKLRAGRKVVGAVGGGAVERDPDGRIVEP
jgi:hypothetical protein